MKFECQESCGGKCCKTGWEGRSFVFLTDKDAERIEKATGRHRDEFSRIAQFDWTRFSKVPVSVRYLTDCEFFDNGKCGIYPSRPTQCRTFPHWPELVDQDLSTSCPGIGQGLEIGNGLLEEQIEADKEYAV